MAAAKGEGGFDVGREFGQEHLAVVGTQNLLHPGAGFVHALVLPPEGTEHFDEKAAGAAGGVRLAE